MAEEFAYDVFVSYSHLDEEWVVGTLVPRLRDAGLEVCIDFESFVGGRAALFNMEDAVKNSRHTLLVLTPNWIASEWSLYEALLARTKDPVGLHRRTVPIQRKKCDLPDSIAMLTWIDFTRPEREAIAWKRLLKDLGAADEPPSPSAAPTRADWCFAHTYGALPNFTGRKEEREMLSAWLGDPQAAPLFVLRALGGFGKTALVWHWLQHDVEPAEFPRVLWWSFYEGEASFDRFLARAHTYLCPHSDTRGGRLQVGEMLAALREPGTLLVLDGFERALRAFAGMGAAYQGDEEEKKPGADEDDGHGCISPFAEDLLLAVTNQPEVRGRILMTSRLRPNVLEKHGELIGGCKERKLAALTPADAVQLFENLGIRGLHSEIEAACAPYGFHPLSLRLLAGQVLKDFQYPADIKAAERLDVSGDVKQRQHHVLEQAYASLPSEEKKLLSRSACFRGAVSYEALAAVSGKLSPRERDTALQDLVKRGVLLRDFEKNRFDLHPIVRRYAYDQLSKEERKTAHRRLRSYFGALARSEKKNVETIEDLTRVIELYHHLVRAEEYDAASRLTESQLIPIPLYFQFGAYTLCIELLRALFPDGEDRPPRLAEKAAQAWVLNSLANSYSLVGQPRRAIPLFEMSNAIDEKRGENMGVAIALGNLSDDQLKTGNLQAAEANLRRQIELIQELDDNFQEAVGHTELGRLLTYRGCWVEAEQELKLALSQFAEGGIVQYMGISWAYRAQLGLLCRRPFSAFSSPNHHANDLNSKTVAAALEALEHAEKYARTEARLPRDFVRAHWVLGAALRENDNLAGAEEHLTEALIHCRTINAVDAEADILLDLARLRLAQNREPDALRLAEEALRITERCGYVLQGADVRLFLGERALAAGARTEALAHAREARRLATCDGPPDYTYKVAYDEAGALLVELGETVDLSE